MPRGGHRENAGRKRGKPNKATAARQAEVQSSGITPLDYMLKVMRDENADPHQRFEAAKSAAPYVHPKVASIQHGKDTDNPLNSVTDADRIAVIKAFLAARPDILKQVQQMH
jgi:hypothetical protein